MSSDKQCCVPGCEDSRGKHQVLHRFPIPEKDKERFNAWLYAVGSDILGLANDHISKYRRVCHSHFENKYLCRNNRISNNAVPTLNLPDPLLSSCKQGCITSSMRKSMQHNIYLTKPSSSTDPNEDFHVQVPSSSTPDAKKQKILEADTLVPEHVPLPHLSLTKTSAEQISGLRAVSKISRKILFTTRENELRRKMVAARVKISKMKNKSKKQFAEIKAARRFATNPGVLETIENCTQPAKLFMQIQWRENKKKEKGRRFSLEEKIVALTIMKQSPKAYRFLRKIFILPASQSLIKLIQMCDLKPGVNKNIFKQLKNKAVSMKTEEKLCAILFDEVSLKASITYQERKDKIAGLVDNGQERKQELANHAQVFMVRGLVKNYRQAVSYTFASSATKGPELSRQLKEIITEVQQAGLIVVATICDQGTNNRHALKLLINETRGLYLRRGEEPRENIILINNQEIVPLYDPPHLLKGMRNNLITKKLQFTKDAVQKIAKWSHLQQLHKENPGYKGIRLIPKLTEHHVNPEKMNKMKVKYASQIFSRTIASNMGYLADKGILPEECKETADLLLFMDNIFDSVNGSYTKNKNAKPLLGPATPKSSHYKTWAEGIQVFKSMKFITPEGKAESVPTVENWVWTLNGIQTLLKKLKDDYKITSVWLRHLNQDPLENFFGAVRNVGCRNINPSCDQFESAFASLLINNFSSVHSQGRNCEADLCSSLHSLIINAEASTTSTCTRTFDFCNILQIEFTEITEKEKDPRVLAPLEYISGYFLKKAKSNIFKSCIYCNNNLNSNEANEYLAYREYAGRRWLCYPSNELIKVISNMQDLINAILKENIEKDNLKEYMKTAICIMVDFSFIKCTEHKKKTIDYLINIEIRCLIFNYCKYINQILAGVRNVDDDDESSIAIKAKKLNRCYKRH